MTPPPKQVAKPRPKPPEPAPVLTAPAEPSPPAFTPAPPAHGKGDDSRARARHEISSTELFGGNREIQIRHAGETYTLRPTSKGKLILTE